MSAECDSSPWSSSMNSSHSWSRCRAIARATSSLRSTLEFTEASTSTGSWLMRLTWTCRGPEARHVVSTLVAMTGRPDERVYESRCVFLTTTGSSKGGNRRAKPSKLVMRVRFPGPASLSFGAGGVLRETQGASGQAVPGPTHQSPISGTAQQPITAWICFASAITSLASATVRCLPDCAFASLITCLSSLHAAARLPAW